MKITNDTGVMRHAMNFIREDLNSNAMFSFYFTYCYLFTQLCLCLLLQKTILTSYIVARPPAVDKQFGIT